MKIGDEKLLTILLGCYGDYPHYSARALQSVLSERADGLPFDLHVGCNMVSPRILRFLREAYDRGHVDSLIESRANINKDPMMRVLVELTETPYLLWLDDDSYLCSGAVAALYEYIYNQHLFDAAGTICCINSFPEYEAAAAQRPWFIGKSARPTRWEDTICFPVGGAFLARTEFLRDHDYPDRCMVKRWDDILLGDLVGQHGDHMFAFNEEVAARVVASAGDRRGEGETAESWRPLPKYRGYEKPPLNHDRELAT